MKSRGATGRFPTSPGIRFHRKSSANSVGSNRSTSSTRSSQSSFEHERLENEGVGAEPGVDPRRGKHPARYAKYEQECVIDVVDYSTLEMHLERYEKNAEFIEALQREGPVGVPPEDRPVRWINVGGISWDVISALAIHYDLEPLALEDVLGEQGHNLSKVDYYPKHMFIRIVAHSVNRSDDKELDQAFSEETVTDHGGAPIFSKLDIENPLEARMQKLLTLPTGLSGYRSERRRRQMLSLHALKKGDKVNIKLEPFFVFLMNDETVITIHPSPSLTFTEPIMQRLKDNDSLLRSHEDASILVQSLLDLIVDRILEMTDAYQDRINHLESRILLHPGMETVRALHILSGDLILHKRTLEPIKSMLYTLRRYDSERTFATKAAYAKSLAAKGRRIGLSSSHGNDPSKILEKEKYLGGFSGSSTPSSTDGHPSPGTGAEGYMSYTAKIYLADVYDHMSFVLASLDMFAGIAENLINYAFNIASYDMNSTMRRLTAATIVFLPLSFLTGYFGQNLQMWSVTQPESLFWIIALPVMVIYLPLVFYSEIRQLAKKIERRMQVRKITASRKKNVHMVPGKARGRE